MTHKLFSSFLRDRLLHGLLVVGLLLTLPNIAHIGAYPGWVNWTTIMTLTGLMLLTKGIELSGYLEHAGRQVIARLAHERSLAIFLATSAAVLSTVLTNDIALFITVPLTLGLRHISKTLPIAKLVIFEALAVNAGSLLTPIGNPQNILLWQQSHLSFVAFTAQLAPLACTVFIVLLALTWLTFSNRPLHAEPQADTVPWNTRQLMICTALYIGFVAAVELHYPVWGLLIVFACVLLFYRRILLEVDWSLIAVFIMMFIDIHLLTDLSFLKIWLDGITQYSTRGIFLSGLLGSQVISNVPATILLLKYLPASKTIAYAVNAGGFGFVLGSLANLIALRMAKERGIWLRFHFYSVPLLIVSGILAYALL